MKKVIVVHGWDGSSEGDWYPWLKKKLLKKKFRVVIPEMPDTMEPKIESWISKLKEVSGKVDKETYFIGHSIGCQAILRYIETLPKRIRVGGVIFVAPWMVLNRKLLLEEGEDVLEVARPWIETPVNWKKVRAHCNKFVCIFSDNDPYVLLSNVEIFRKNLDAEAVIESGKGHFTFDDGVSELPVVLEKLKEMKKG